MPPAVLSTWQRRLLRGTTPRRVLGALAAFRPTTMAGDGAPNPLLAATPQASTREEPERLALCLAIGHASSAGRPAGPGMRLHGDPVAWLEDHIAGLKLRRTARAIAQLAIYERA